MYRLLSRLGSVAIATAVVLPGFGYAFDAAVPGKVAFVKNTTGAEADRRIVIRAKGNVPGGCSVDITQVPTLRIVTTGATASDVTYDLPDDGNFAGRPGWTFSPKNGAVQVVFFGSVQGEPIKRLRIRFVLTDTGCRWSISALALGTVGTQDVTVLPPNPGTGLSMIFTDGLGSRLCVSFGGAAGGTITTDTDKIFKILNPTSAPACP